MIKKGRYQHYKGNNYEVLDTAKHSETGETLVLYRPCYGERALWVRPLEMFQEEVNVEGKLIQRFVFIEETK